MDKRKSRFKGTLWNAERQEQCSEQWGDRKTHNAGFLGFFPFPAGNLGNRAYDIVLFLPFFSAAKTWIKQYCLTLKITKIDYLIGLKCLSVMTW